MLPPICLDYEFCEGVQFLHITPLNTIYKILLLVPASLQNNQSWKWMSSHTELKYISVFSSEMLPNDTQYTEHSEGNLITCRLKWQMKVSLWWSNRKSHLIHHLSSSALLIKKSQNSYLSYCFWTCIHLNINVLLAPAHSMFEMWKISHFAQIL